MLFAACLPQFQPTLLIVVCFRSVLFILDFARALWWLFDPQNCVKQQPAMQILFSRFFRKASRAAFATLPRDQQLVYEQLAENSRFVAQSNRAAAAAAADRAAAEANLHAPNPGAPERTRPALQADLGDRAQALAVHVPRQADDIQPLLDGASAAMEEAYPLSEEALAVRRGGAKIIDICSAFKRACCTFAKPLTPDKGFPAKVGYQASCGAMCMTRTPPRTLAAYLELVDGLERVAGCPGYVTARPYEVLE